MPPLGPGSLYPNQIMAITNLEHSLKLDKPRALIQMATGSGKTIMAVRDLPPDQVRRRRACCSWSTAPTSASRRRRSSELPFAGRQPQVHRAVQRPAPRPRTPSAPRARWSSPPSSACTRCSRASPAFDPEAEAKVPGSTDDKSDSPAEEAAPRRLQPRDPARALRRHLRRRVPPLHLLAVAAGAGVLRRLPDRPHRHAGEAHLRLLQAEPGHGVRPRARPWPTASTSTSRSTSIRTKITEAGLHHRRGLRHARLPRPPHPQGALGERPTRPGELRRRRPRPQRRRQGPDPPHRPAFRDKVFPETFPAARRSRRRSSSPRTTRTPRTSSTSCARSSAGGTTSASKITYKTTGKKPEGADPGLPHRLLPARRRHGRSHRHRHGHQARRDRDVHAHGEEPRALRADEGARRAHHRPQRAAQGVTPDARAKTHFLIVDCVGVTESDLPDTRPLEQKRARRSRHAAGARGLGRHGSRTSLSSLASRLSPAWTSSAARSGDPSR
jgi:type I restriction enzyme R subunit